MKFLMSLFSVSSWVNRTIRLPYHLSPTFSAPGKSYDEVSDESMEEVFYPSSFVSMT